MWGWTSVVVGQMSGRTNVGRTNVGRTNVGRTKVASPILAFNFLGNKFRLSEKTLVTFCVCNLCVTLDVHLRVLSVMTCFVGNIFSGTSVSRIISVLLIYFETSRTAMHVLYAA
jgi:hypothetical protein